MTNASHLMIWPMRRVLNRLWALVLLLVLGLPALALAQAAAPVALGQPLPTLNLKDQHDKPWHIAPGTRLVLFAAGRQASNLVQAVLEALPKDQLTQKNAVYLADMSKMPGFITRTFALPVLRDMSYPIGVSMDDTTLAGWPRQPDAVTLIELDQGLLKSIRFVTTEADLRAALAR
ncbi:hypothetical protein LHU53_05980 [Rhodoferax sp. U2-2l]|uniref:hypothetical protein n=1 Tax=Rhodoferax sp. U2-2l TaxID=2884000 RepID=UPI001D09FF78|nr:hypothetical protein [Rhodoferax sp. U2-2l]MCB8746451.1 hypothetical protein [Rhodoferax sp. U2-2l]